MSNVLKRIATLAAPPTSNTDIAKWLANDDSLAFLETNAGDDDIVIFASLPHVFIHAVTVPVSLIYEPDSADLLSWNCGTDSGWSVCYSWQGTPPVYIEAPLDHTGSNTIDQGEPLIFRRSFEGLRGGRTYIEVLQRLVHVSSLHFVYERDAYCRIDERGDIEDVIKISTINRSKGEAGGTVVTCKRDVLEQWLALNDSALVRMFDFTRMVPKRFGMWGDNHDPKVVGGKLLSYRTAIQPDRAGYVRGYQIIKTDLTRQALLDQFDGEDVSRKYESFIGHDWKNGTVRDISTEPGATANYFTKSDLPFETSPAFFRPEVLSKYKADSEKYCLEDGSISCRGAWHLSTYDINEEGQVHTYIVYLRDLPYEEQLYWKVYNEPPKAPISKRAIMTDFEASWDLEYDALTSLKGLLREIQERGEPWWTLRSEDLPARVQYPATSSPDEWANELLGLDQLLVEGFEERWLRAEATRLGRTPDQRSRSLKLVEECLVGCGFEADHARGITAPLHRLHNLRSKVKGHASGQDASDAKRETLKEHGTFRKHFEALCAECDESVKIISDAMSGRVVTSTDQGS
jgi:hypothetical protein